MFYKGPLSVLGPWIPPDFPPPLRRPCQGLLYFFNKPINSVTHTHYFFTKPVTSATHTLYFFTKTGTSATHTRPTACFLLTENEKTLAQRCALQPGGETHLRHEPNNQPACSLRPASIICTSLSIPSNEAWRAATPTPHSGRDAHEADQMPGLRRSSLTTREATSW